MSFELLDKSIVTRYLTSLYFSVITITTIGYGDFYAKTDYEKIFLICMAFFSSVFFGYIMGSVG